MFRKLRSNFVMTEVSLLSIVLIISFSAIYISTATRLYNGPQGRPPTPTMTGGRFGTTEFQAYIDQQRRADADQVLRDLAITLTLIGIATLTAGFFVSRYLANRAIKPVEHAYERERQFVADASHELKTPLAVISANIEAELVDKKRPSKWLRAVQDETSQMNNLVTNLLQLADVNLRESKRQFLTFDVSRVIETALLAINPLLKQNSFTVVNRLATPLLVTSDKNTLAHIIRILLDNAVKYSVGKKEITITGQLVNGRVELHISNPHPPLSDATLARLFDRFYQADESHHDSGHGLGLAIARSFAERIGATLEVSQESGRITFTLSI